MAVIICPSPVVPVSPSTILCMMRHERPWHSRWVRRRVHEQLPQLLHKALCLVAEEPLEVGDTVEVSLDFDRSRSVALDVPVIAPEELAERIGEDG